MKFQSKRNFQAEIRPEKLSKNTGDIVTHGIKNEPSPDNSLLEIAKNSGEETQPLQKLKPEQVPFKDLESLFVK